MKFTKMHGLGNDYLYVYGCIPDNPGQLSVKLSDRHFGAGSDGMIYILPSDIADFKMRIFNADGSEAKMCGNGSRCVGKYVYDYGLTDKNVVTLETLAGIKTLHLHVNKGKVDSVTVDMGEPVISVREIPVIYNNEMMVNAPVDTSCGVIEMTAVSMGNPHGVVFVDSLDNVDVHGLGRELEIHSMWPDRANIEFAQINSPSEITMRVWERGSGETMACGTGACATAVAAAITGRTGDRVTVHLLGGDLEIYRNPDDSHIYMTGGATTVFEGVYERQS